MSIRSAPTITRSRLLAAALGVVTLLAAACTDDSGWTNSSPGPRAPGGASLVTPVALERVQSCEQLVDHARSSLAQAVEWWGAANAPAVARVHGENAGGIDGFAADESMATAAPDDGTGAAGTSELVGTNNQELGVEEADVVDLDDDRLVWVDDGVLRVAELDDDVTIDGTLDLSDRGPTDLFLQGDRVLVLGTSHGAVIDDVDATAPARPAPDIGLVGSATTTLTTVSIADPMAPTVLEATDVEGDLLSAREIDGVARLVVRSWPRAFDELPVPSTPAEAEALLDDLEGEQLLPQRWDDGTATPLGDCADVAVLPVGPEGPVVDAANLSVLRIGDDLADLAPVTIQGNAETVYASSSALYVAATGWDGQGPTTDVHRFDLSGDGPATHTGSGAVPGRLLNQFALSERGDHLRVVTTTDGGLQRMVPTQEQGLDVEPSLSEGRLTVLDTDGPLDEVGHVDGLGPNEEVHSVRFVDDIAYVVTFRRTDPLYAIDLSVPSDPTVLGELKITGFSEYLHPAGNGLLLGVGREVDEATGMDRGMKVSLFDVSDPTDLTEVDRFVLPDAWSPVGSADHRGFTWDPARNRAIIPTDAAALVVQVDGPALSTVAELSHPGQWGPVGPHRSRLHDGTIWTISPTGLGRTDADPPDGVEMVSR